jgi:3-oxoacyl-[acyl-carrier-protein] synthase I
MKDVFIISDNILSPIGNGSAENFLQVQNNVSGIKMHSNASMSAVPFYSALFNGEEYFLQNSLDNNFTKFEKILIASVSQALENSSINVSDKKTGLIISSTKGNVSLLETETYNASLQEKISLSSSANLIAAHFKIASKPIVVSNACISGLLALLTGMRLIQSGQYDNVVVAGADVISKFVLSGFQSFNAISENPCKPFDANRNGINLGEGAATIILSASKKTSQDIKIMGGSVSNDANHISGPSRTGEELNIAITKAMKEAKLFSPNDIDFISAHGTATIYNDEMEAKAITLANMQHVPTNSLKGYYGHTLGAAGVIEAIIAIHSLKENTIIPTKGFENIGVTEPINVCSSLQKNNLRNCLKTASGFGGCNAALVFSKQ